MPDGKTTTNLEKVISSYRGKTILVDIWATWCAPCRAELPYLKSLLQTYSTENIQLISISIEREIQPWQKFVLSDGQKNNNSYLLINPDKSSFVKQHNITEIPRYMLINKEGTIVNSNAPRPGDEELKYLIDNLTQVQ